MNSTFATRVYASLELMRPANVVTAFADILAGAAIAVGVLNISAPDSVVYPFNTDLVFLLLSTFGLYGGGIVFNDVFDADLDAIERPERAIPSGRISKMAASILGLALFIIGVFSAWLVDEVAGFIAFTVALAALLYDYKAKHHPVFGPLVMGGCRAGNLMLGVAIMPAALWSAWAIAFLPVLYIGSITLISRGEVHGGSSVTSYLATMAVSVVVAVLFGLSLIESYQMSTAAPFAILFGGMVLPAFASAGSDPVPGKIKKAVKRGVISLIILNSAIAGGFAGYSIGLLVLALLPFSFLLSRMFDVT